MATKRKSRATPKKADGGKKAKPVKKEEVSEEEDNSDEGKRGAEVSDEEEDESDDEDRGRGKRKRRESKSYEPDDFTLTSVNAAMKAATVSQGRGTKLGEIDASKKAMRKFTLTSEEFIFAYKFLFSNRGTGNKKLMKDKLHDFSGYLPPLPKGKYNKKKQEDEDEVIETKYAVKAFKMNKSQIETLCDFFGVGYSGDGGKSIIKEDMIDRLLDFLGEPDQSVLVQKEPPVTKKKTTPKPKKASQPKSRQAVKVKVKEESSKPPYHLIKDYEKGKVPSDDAMRQWVQAYIVCVDMETATTKDAILTATAKFGVEMSSKKARIKELLAEEI